MTRRDSCATISPSSLPPNVVNAYVLILIRPRRELRAWQSCGIDEERLSVTGFKTYAEAHAAIDRKEYNRFYFWRIELNGRMCLE